MRGYAALPTLAVVEAAMALVGCGRRGGAQTLASADRVATVESGARTRTRTGTSTDTSTDTSESTSAGTGTSTGASAGASASCDGRAAPSGSILPRAMTVAGPGQGMMVLPVKMKIVSGAVGNDEHVLAKNQWRWRTCARQAMAREEKLPVTVRVTVSIDDDGNATKAVATGAPSKETATCLEDALRAPNYVPNETKAHALTVALTLGEKP